MVTYEAVLFRLQKLRAMGVQNCIIKIDSNVIAAQIEKESSGLIVQGK
jgi:ribonuclease HI